MACASRLQVVNVYSHSPFPVYAMYNAGIPVSQINATNAALYTLCIKHQIGKIIRILPPHPLLLLSSLVG